MNIIGRFVGVKVGLWAVCGR